MVMLLEWMAEVLLNGLLKMWNFQLKWYSCCPSICWNSWERTWECSVNSDKQLTLSSCIKDDDEQQKLEGVISELSIAIVSQMVKFNFWFKMTWVSIVLSRHIDFLTMKVLSKFQETKMMFFLLGIFWWEEEILKFMKMRSTGFLEKIYLSWDHVTLWCDKENEFEIWRRQEEIYFLSMDDSAIWKCLWKCQSELQRNYENWWWEFYQE